MNEALAASRRPAALVTGASRGIGAEFARLLARDHYDLVLVARSRNELEQLAHELRQEHHVQVTVLEQDLASATAPRGIFDALTAQGVQVDVLVNNAGFGTYGPFVETDLEAELHLLAVNVIALTHLTKLFVQPMVARGRGRILNVASTAAFQPGPLMAVYYASKAYVLSFSEALVNELSGTGVTLTALCPGATASGFQDRAAMHQSRLVQGAMMDAASVARAGYEGLLHGKAIVIPGLANRLMAQSSRFAPRWLVRRIVRRIMDPVKS